MIFQVAVKKAASKQGKIYVGKFTGPITEDEIRSHFEQVGIKNNSEVATKLEDLHLRSKLSLTFIFLNSWQRWPI